MLQQVHSAQSFAHAMPVRFDGDASTSDAVQSLISNARRSLEEDPHLARNLLDKALALFGQPVLAEPIPYELKPKSPVPAGTRGGLAPWQLRKTTEHIENALGANISVEDLAEIAKVSVGHFCRAFKVSTGEAPHAFIIRERLRRAQFLMLESEDSLSRIAIACGFTDQAHLPRLFRREVGTTPLAWRRACRKA